MLPILEALAIILALLYVFWAARGSLWCWPAALLSSGIYIFLCYEARLYPETLLQIFYLVFAILGWVKWKKTESKNSSTYRKTGKFKLMVIVISGSLLSLPAGYFFDFYTDTALPWLDAPILVFSLISTWMVAEKFLENWYFWMIIDLAAAYLYWSRAMNLTAMLYLFYVLLAVWGLKKWKEKTL